MVYEPVQVRSWVCRACGVVFESRHKRKLCREGCVGSRECAGCGGLLGERQSKYCSHACYTASCRGAHPERRTRPDEDELTRRRDRELRAPGLSQWSRKKLRRRWARQGRRCVYCGERCETIDHVVPLVRGGTNYEGNLVPCCRRCNSSKRDLLLTEWRAGRKLAPKFLEARAWM